MIDLLGRKDFQATDFLELLFLFGLGCCNICFFFFFGGGGGGGGWLHFIHIILYILGVLYNYIIYTFYDAYSVTSFMS